MPTRSCTTGGLVALALMAAGSTAVASGELRPEDRIKDTMEAAPAELDGVGLDEKLGASIPLDLAFRDETGASVTLGELTAGDLPVILTLNYSDCPMLCNLMLGGLAKTLLDIPHTDGVPNLVPGRQFRIITVSIDPDETLERVRDTKASYVERFPADQQADVSRGWRFLTGDKASIDALADAVGFRYRYLSRQDDYLHPSVIMVLAADGTVNQYLKGIEYPPSVFADAVFAAGMKDPRASVGFLYSCFHYDSKANDYSNFGRRLMSLVGGAFALAIFAFLGTWHVLRTRKSRIGV